MWGLPAAQRAPPQAHVPPLAPFRLAQERRKESGHHGARKTIPNFLRLFNCAKSVCLRSGLI